MATHWRISFKSFLGTSYNLNIDEIGYSGSIVMLTGSEHPFITQEDNSDDVFKVIRGQSGKINILTNDANILPTIMPISNLSRRVELVKVSDSSVKWRGFIPASAYSQPQDNSYYNVTIPVKSVLSSLDNARFDGYYGRFLSISDIIKNVFAKVGITLGTDANVYFQTEMKDFTDYLSCVICTSVFYNIKTIMNNDAPVQEVVPNSCGAVLEAILKPMGLTIHEFAGNFYIVENAKLYDNQSFVTFKGYDFTAKQATTNNTVGKLSISGQDSYIASDNLKIAFNPGAKEVNVCFSLEDSSVIDSGNPSTPYSTNTLYGGTKLVGGEADGVIYAQLVDTPSIPRRKLWTETFYTKSQQYYNRTSSGQKIFSQSEATGSDLILDSAYQMDTLGHITNTPEMFGQGGTIGAILCREGSGENRKDINLTPGLMINMISAYRMALYYGVTSTMPTGANDKVYVLETNSGYAFKSGYIHLELDYKVIEYYQRGYTESGGPNIKVYIGNTEINVQGANGYHITELMEGSLRIVIYGGTSYPFADPCTIVIKKLRLYWSIRADEVTASKEDENLYMTLISRDFTDTKEINTLIGTDNNNKASTSILYNSNMESVVAMQIYDSNPSHLLRPEKYLLQLMENQYTGIQRTMTRTFRREWNYLPGTPFKENGINYLFVTDKMNWANDEITIKFIQTYQP